MIPRRRTQGSRPGLSTVLMFVAALAPMPANAGGGAGCSLSATPLAFGKYVPSSGSPSDFTATITVTCTASGATPGPVHGTISLLGAGGLSGRQLADGGRRLRYQLYLDPARTIVWESGSGGDGTASVSGVVSPTTPCRQTFTVYGRIRARQSEARVGITPTSLPLFSIIDAIRGTSSAKDG
jgi:spore coat protein U-like protein